MVILQERDLRILRLAREHQFITLGQVKPLFESYKRCSKRISQLKAGGYFREEPSLRVGRDRVLRLTSLGCATAANDSPYSIQPRRFLEPATLTHQAIVTSVRIVLEQKLSIGQFVPEEAIKALGLRQIPDGVYFFENGRGIAIEVENSKKGPKRFLSIHERWQDEPDIFFVLFVATTADIASFIQSLLPQLPNDQPFGVILWDALQAGIDPIWTPEGTLTLIQIKERIQ